LAVSRGFPERLRRAIELAGLNQTSFAEQMTITGVRGSSRRTLTYYLAGDTEPTNAWLETAAMILGVRLPWLRDGEGGVYDVDPETGSGTRMVFRLVDLKAESDAAAQKVRSRLAQEMEPLCGLYGVPYEAERAIITAAVHLAMRHPYRFNRRTPEEVTYSDLASWLERWEPDTYTHHTHAEQVAVWLTVASLIYQTQFTPGGGE